VSNKLLLQQPKYYKNAAIVTINLLRVTSGCICVGEFCWVDWPSRVRQIRSTAKLSTSRAWS